MAAYEHPCADARVDDGRHQVYAAGLLHDSRMVSYLRAIDDNPEDPALVKTKYVENTMTEILISLPVRTNSTKAVDCSILRQRA